MSTCEVSVVHSYEDVHELKSLEGLAAQCVAIDTSGWSNVPTQAIEKICASIEESTSDSITLTMRDAKLSSESLQLLSSAVSLNSTLDSISLNFINCEGLLSKSDVVSLCTGFILNTNMQTLHLGLRYSKELSDESVFQICESLSNTTLTSLSLNFEYSFNITDSTLEMIAIALSTRFVRLKVFELNVNGCAVTGEGIKVLTQGIASAAQISSFTLKIQGCDGVSGDGLASLGRCFEKLEQQNLHIGESDAITNENLKQLFESAISVSDKKSSKLKKNNSQFSLFVDSCQLISSELITGIWDLSLHCSKDIQSIRLAVSRCKGFSNALKVASELVVKHPVNNAAENVVLDLSNQSLQLENALEAVNIISKSKMKVILNAQQVSQCSISEDNNNSISMVNDSFMNGEPTSDVKECQLPTRVYNLSYFNHTEETVSVVSVKTNIDPSCSGLVKITIDGGRASDSAVSVMREVNRAMKQMSRSIDISEIVFEISGELISWNGGQLRVILESLKWCNLPLKRVEIIVKKGGISDSCLSEVGKAILYRSCQVHEWKFSFSDCRNVSDKGFGDLVGWMEAQQRYTSGVALSFEECSEITNAGILRLSSSIKAANQVAWRFMNVARITDAGLDAIQNEVQQRLESENKVMLSPQKMSMMFVSCPLLSIKKIVQLQKYLKSIGNQE